MKGMSLIGIVGAAYHPCPGEHNVIAWFIRNNMVLASKPFANIKNIYYPMQTNYVLSQIFSNIVWIREWKGTGYKSTNRSATQSTSVLLE